MVGRSILSNSSMLRRFFEYIVCLSEFGSMLLTSSTVAARREVLWAEFISAVDLRSLSSYSYEEADRDIGDSPPVLWAWLVESGCCYICYSAAACDSIHEAVMKGHLLILLLLSVALTQAVAGNERPIIGINV